MNAPLSTAIDVEVVGEVAADLQRQLGDALLNLLFGE